MANTDRRLSYNQHFKDASQIDVNKFSKEYIDGDWIGEGEIVICNDDNNPGLYVTNVGYDKVYKINSTENITVSDDYEGVDGGVVVPGEKLEKAIFDLETKVVELQGDAGGSNDTIDKVIDGVGLADDGSHIQTSGNYTSEATTVVGEIDALDKVVKKVNDDVVALSGATKDGFDGLDGLIKELSGVTKEIVTQADSDRIKSGDGTIVITTADTGTTIDVNVDGETIVINKNKELSSALTLKKLETPSSSAMSATYELGYLNTNDLWVKLGDSINIQKDQFLKSVKLGKFTWTDPESNIVHNAEEALQFVFYTEGGVETQIYIGVADFLRENEFKEGLQVVDGAVSVRISPNSDKDAYGNSLLYIDQTDAGKGLAIKGLAELITKVNDLQKDTASLINRTEYQGDVDTFSVVNVNTTFDEDGNLNKIVTVKNEIYKGSISNATLENDGLVTATAVRQHFISEMDGDDVYVGDAPILPSQSTGRINFDSTSSDYDSIHRALYKLDNNLQRIDETLGVPTNGSQIHQYPVNKVSTMQYISGTTNIMSALYTLDASLAQEKQNLRNDLDEFSANTVAALNEFSANTVAAIDTITVSSDGNSIHVNVRDFVDTGEVDEEGNQIMKPNGTNLEVNIHSGRTGVSMTDPEVIAKDKNFLEQTVGGDEGLKVTGMDSDVTVTTEPIRILGWANQIGAGVYTNWTGGADISTGDTGLNYIPAGTSVQEILENLFAKVLYPNNATLPTMSVSLGSTPTSVVELGGSVTIPKASITTTVGKFNAGYSNISQPTPVVTWKNKLISTSKTGFTNYAIESKETLTAVSVNADLGTNKVLFTGTATYEAPSNNPLRNDGLATTKTGRTAADGSAIWVEGNTSATNSVTVTGVYPCYTNISGSALVSEPTTKLGLTTGSSFTVNNVPAETASVHFKFAFPADRTVSSFKVKDPSGRFVTFTGQYTQTETVTKTINGKSYSYKILQTVGNVLQGKGTSYQITLDKELSK